MADPGTYFVGLRDEVVDLLVSGVSVDLVGHAGSGRTTLVASVTSGLLERGWETVDVRGIAALADRPLEALALADLARRPDQRPGESPVAAAAARVRSAISDGRTVLTVDDADDLDPASIGVIEGAHAQGPFPVLTTSRARPPRNRAAVTLPAELRPGVTLQVPPLNFVEVHAILTEVLPGQIDPQTLARINAITGGLPSLVVAVGNGARRTGRIRLVDGVWVAGSDLWSPGLARVVQSLVADLDAEAVEALQMLSLAGAVSVSTAAALVGWQALEDLDASGLLRFAPRGDEVVLGVYPPLVEERYRHLPLGARRLHFDARMTALLDPSAAERAGTTLLPRAVTAPQFWPGASEAAWPALPDSPRRDQTTELADTVRARLMREEWHRQYLLRRREWEHDPSPTTAAPYLRAMLVSDADAEEMLDVVARTPTTGELPELAAFYRWHARVLAYAADDSVGARALLERRAAEVGPWAGLLHAVQDYLTLSFERVPDRRPADDPAMTHQFTDALAAAVDIATGRVDDALEVLTANDWTDPDIVITGEVLRGLALLVAGDVDQSLAWSTEHLEEARRVLDPEGVPGHAYVAVSALLLLGRMHDVRALLGSVLAIGLTSSVQRHFMSALLELAAALAAHDGLESPAETFYVQARSTSLGPSALPLPTWSWATTRPVPGFPGNGTDEADQLWETVVDYLERGFVVSAVMLGGSAIDLAPDAERVAVLRGAAGQDAAGLVESTVQVAEAAVDPDVDVGVRLGRQLIDAGMVSLGVRAIGQSVRRLREAGDGAQAATLLEDTRRRLSRLGVDPHPVLGSLGPTAQLTPREQEVGALVAGGMSNGEIATALHITTKTVENHLNRLMRKLGVSDRAGVAASFR